MQDFPLKDFDISQGSRRICNKFNALQPAPHAPAFYSNRGKGSQANDTGNDEGHEYEFPESEGLVENSDAKGNDADQTEACPNRIRNPDGDNINGFRQCDDRPYSE